MSVLTLEARLGEHTYRYERNAQGGWQFSVDGGAMPKTSGHLDDGSMLWEFARLLHDSELPGGVGRGSES